MCEFITYEVLEEEYSSGWSPTSHEYVVRILSKNGNAEDDAVIFCANRRVTRQVEMFAMATATYKPRATINDNNIIQLRELLGISNKFIIGCDGWESASKHCKLKEVKKSTESNEEPKNIFQEEL